MSVSSHINYWNKIIFFVLLQPFSNAQKTSRQHTIKRQSVAHRWRQTTDWLCAGFTVHIITWSKGVWLRPITTEKLLFCSCLQLNIGETLKHNRECHQLAAEVHSASSLALYSKTIKNIGPWRTRFHFAVQYLLPWILSPFIKEISVRWRQQTLSGQSGGYEAGLLGVTPHWFCSAKKGPNANC